MMGDTTVPTRPASDNSNAAASTAYVTSAIATAIAGIVFPTPIPSGTVMLFYQSAAPTGWTQVTTQNDKALRVVSGSGGVAGGTNSFSTVFAQTTVGNHTLTTAELASHTHTTATGLSGTGGTFDFRPCGTQNQTSGTGSAGSGTAHNHTITMSIQFIDIILCSKN